MEKRNSNKKYIDIANRYFLDIDRKKNNVFIILQGFSLSKIIPQFYKRDSKIPTIAQYSTILPQ